MSFGSATFLERLAGDVSLDQMLKRPVGHRRLLTLATISLLTIATLADPAGASSNPNLGAHWPRLPDASQPAIESPPPTAAANENFERVVTPLHLQDAPQWTTKLKLPDLPITWDERVLKYLDHYKNNPRGRRLMRYWLSQQGRHRALISRTLRRYGLPQALTYVAMIESGYSSDAKSRKRAVGVWQFVKSSATAYGLTVDQWIDERRDPERASEAAARMLRDLYQQFGSWPLALAAYNAGSGMVSAAMRKYNTNDYWQLCTYEAGLPWSTSLYVSKVFAVAIVGENRDYFGFADVVDVPEQRFELVSVKGSMSLAKIAKIGGHDPTQLERLNAHYWRQRTPPAIRSWVRLPTDGAARYYAALGGQAGLEQRERSHEIRQGDTIANVAQRYKIAPGLLRSLNHLRPTDLLEPGQRLLLPPKPATVARKATVPRDKKLLVALPDSAPSAIANRQRVFYRVMRGDTLSEIANRLGISSAEIASWNGLADRGRLVPGMVLQAFIENSRSPSQLGLFTLDQVQLMTTGSAAFLNQHEKSKNRRRLRYRVRKNDTIKRVARRFGLTVGSFLRINRFGHDHDLRPGAEVIVYAPGRAKAGQAIKPGYYRVQHGDNPTTIAKRFGISISELLKLNRLAPDPVLQINQLLKVRDKRVDKKRRKSSELSRR